MNEERPGLFARIGTAFSVFFLVLFNAVFAARLRKLLQAKPADIPPPAKRRASRSHPALLKHPPDAALQLLALLQREGRLVDFLNEDISSYGDADVGAAARVVHDGCKKVLDEHMTLTSIRTEEEGAQITLAADFAASEVRLTGTVAGAAPFRGTLNHRGWRATHVSLPELSEGHDVHVIAPAEVEL